MRLLALLARFYPAYTIEALAELPMAQITLMYDELTGDPHDDDMDGD